MSLTSSPESLAEFYIFALIFFSKSPSCSLRSFFMASCAFSWMHYFLFSLSLDLEGFVFIMIIYFYDFSLCILSFSIPDPLVCKSRPHELSLPRPTVPDMANQS